MALTDYEELAARSFDEHHDPELRAAVQVCADALGQIDDPRGPLISFEYALYDALPKRALELRRAMHAHASEHAIALLGEGAAPLLKQPRAIACEWRSGMMYGLYIDARYITKRAKLSAGDLVRIALKAPAAKRLRRLRVRVRTPEDVTSIMTMLGKVKHQHALPLEEIELGGRVWPERFQSSPPPGFAPVAQLYPNLYYLATNNTIVSLCAVNKVQVSDVLFADAPTKLGPRRFIGRALTSGDDRLREAALQRIVALGPAAGVYARVLHVMLQPRVTTPILPVIAALRALGESRDNSLALAKLSSRTKQYDVAARKAAGAAAAAIRPPDPTPAS